MNNDKIFIYGDTELSYLSSADPKLKFLINKYGFIERKVNNDVFQSLVRSLVSQLISSKAAATIMQRIYDLYREPFTAQDILKTDDQMLRSCGLSEKKVINIKIIAKAVQENSISFSMFNKMNDNEIISVLTSFSGIGKWTAEMFLIFCMERKDIISFDDFVIRKAIQSLYSIGKLNKKSFEMITQKFSPYSTIASFYLWKHGNSLS